MIVPGRILVIDDVPEQVSEMVNSLRLKGESVIFTTSMPEDDFLENIRLLVIDLYLVGDDKEASYDAVASILEKVSEKTEFFIIALYSKYTDDAVKNKLIIEELKELFHRRTEADLRAFFLEPFDKSTIMPTELVERLEKAITSNPICGLLLEVERCIEKARDHAASDIISAASIPLVLKTLREEIGDIALHREMIQLFLKILSRYSRPTKAMKAYINEILKLSLKIDPEKYGQIYSLQSYYDVPIEERPWTGDILKRDSKYAVAVSPACDFAQCKLDHIKFISAIRINHSDAINKDVLDRLKSKLKIAGSTKAFAKALLKDGSFLPKRFHILRFLKDSDGTFFHLILDFQLITKLCFKEKVRELGGGNWIRVCRIDTPIIENLLQKCSTYSSRIGIQSIPEHIVKSTVGKIKKQPTDTN